MTQNFYALCGGGDDLEIKRIKVNATTQAKLEAMFQDQHSTFMSGITNELEFSGDWNPENDELIYFPVSDVPEISKIEAAISGNATSLSAVDASNLAGEDVKAIFTGTKVNSALKVQLQKFNTGQILARNRFVVVFESNQFKEFTMPAISLDNKLLCVVEGGRVKFKSFHTMKQVFSLSEHFKEASDEDIDEFSNNRKIEISDLNTFKENANQEIRKLVHKVMKSNSLSTHTAQHIKTKARSDVALDLAINAKGALVMPEDTKEIRLFLSFLDDGLYKGSLTGKRYRAKGKQES